MSIVDNARELAEVIKRFNNPEADSKLSELTERILALVDENLRLREELQASDKDAGLPQRIIWERPYYWIKYENGKRDGPFCQKCQDTEKKLVRLQGKSKGHWMCMACKSVFLDSDFKPNPGRAIGPRRGFVDRY